jgi:hypothetical protein
MRLEEIARYCVPNYTAEQIEFLRIYGVLSKTRAISGIKRLPT